MKRFLIVAPYCPGNRPGLKATGASTKIEAALVGLRRNKFRPVLLNSGHQRAAFSSARISALHLGDASAIEIQPTALRWRSLGKAFQVLLAPLYALDFARRENVQGIWLYNSYLFEGIFAVCFHRLAPRVPIVLEMEDAPTARKRPGTGRIKVMLDALATGMTCRLARVITVVHPNLRKLARNTNAHIMDLPALLREREPAMAKGRQPGGCFDIGYFGTLNREKGVDVLLDVMRSCGQHIRWHLCGDGELAGDVRTLAAEMGDRLNYYGALDTPGCWRVYDKVDAVISLHRPLAEYGDGIFPSKFLEAVAMNKLLLSTETSGCPEEVQDAVVWLHGDPVQAVREATDRLGEMLSRTVSERQRAGEWVRRSFGAKHVIAGVLARIAA